MDVFNATAADNFFTNAAFGDRREPYILQTIGIFDLKRHSFKGQLKSLIYRVRRNGGRSSKKFVFASLRVHSVLLSVGLGRSSFDGLGAKCPTYSLQVSIVFAMSIS